MFIAICLVLFSLFACIRGNAERAIYQKLEIPEFLSDGIEKHLRMSRNGTEGGKCMAELDKYAQGIRNGELWALKMLDASGKLPAGILTGNMGDFGDFDQCLQIEQANTDIGPIYGKYCVAYLSLFSPGPSANTYGGSTDAAQIALPPLTNGICSPNGCTALELQEFYRGLGLAVTMQEEMCQDKFTEPELGTPEIVAIVLLGTVLCLMVFSTTYDAILYYTRKEPAYVLLTSFSVLSNVKKLVETNKNPNQLSCLHGLRLFSLMWVILGHRYALNELFPLNNSTDALESIEEPVIMVALGAHVVVDTFLMLSGLVISYGFMVAMARGIKFNVPLYYLHRYLRLTPALGAVILVTAILIPFFGSGPFWPIFMRSVTKPCEDYWWSALLYVQNYVNPLEICVVQSHYLSVDTQLFILSPLLLIPLKKKPKLTMYATGGLIVLSILTPLLIAWFYELRPYVVVNGIITQSNDNRKYFYYVTHARAASWLIGFVLGYVLYRTKLSGIRRLTNYKHFGAVNLALWMISLGVIATCVFGWHHLILEEYDRVAYTFVIGLVRPAWSTAIAWIIFSCVHGYGGPVNWLLSLPLCQFMSKLSYTMYIVHLLPIMVSGLRNRNPLRFGHFEVVYTFCGDLIFTFLLSIVWTLAFESPIVSIEKVLLKGNDGKKQPKPEGVKANDSA